MAKTKIEWADDVWNPVTGCTKVSPGCKNCYAERMAKRLQAMGQPRYANGFKVAFHENILTLPFRWKKPRRIFVNSMSDLFHEDVPDTFIDRVFVVMDAATNHQFLVLTKRPERMVKISEWWHRYDEVWPTNVWAGVSVENQENAWRLDYLAKVPAPVRFVSCEPLLGPLDLRQWLAHYGPGYCREAGDGATFAGYTGTPVAWVICGGESGPGARPMHPDWVRGLRDQCVAAGVPFFFKQWGEYEPVSAVGDEDDGNEERIARADLDRCKILDRTGHIWPAWQPPVGSWMMERVGRKAAGALLDGREWREAPQ